MRKTMTSEELKFVAHLMVQEMKVWYSQEINNLKTDLKNEIGNDQDHILTSMNDMRALTNRIDYKLDNFMLKLENQFLKEKKKNAL